MYFSVSATLHLKKYEQKKPKIIWKANKGVKKGSIAREHGNIKKKANSGNNLLKTYISGSYFSSNLNAFSSLYLVTQEKLYNMILSIFSLSDKDFKCVWLV